MLDRFITVYRQEFYHQFQILILIFFRRDLVQLFDDRNEQRIQNCLILAYFRNQKLPQTRVLNILVKSIGLGDTCVLRVCILRHSLQVLVLRSWDLGHDLVFLDGLLNDLLALSELRWLQLYLVFFILYEESVLLWNAKILSNVIENNFACFVIDHRFFGDPL